jgi:HEAT repeat protein
MRRAGILLTAVVALLMCAPGVSSLATAAETAEPDTAGLTGLTPEQLFLRASSSALQFQHLIEPSKEILVKRYEASLPFLVTRLDTDEVRERNALEDILVRIGEPAVPVVIEAFLKEAERADTSRGARLAARVLGRLGSPEAVGPLASARSHHDWKLRGAIAEALGRIGDADSVEPLVALLSDENEIVRKSAAVGLRRVATRASDDENGDARARKALDRHVIRTLVSSLSDSYYAVRYSAADALSAIGLPALSDLLEVCRKGDGPARLMAFRAVGGVGSGKAAKELLKAMEDPDWAVRAYAAVAMGEIGPDRRGESALERLARNDPHPLVVAEARKALLASGSGS